MRPYAIRFGSAAAAQFRDLSVHPRTQIQNRMRLLAGRAAQEAIHEYHGVTKMVRVREANGHFLLALVAHHWVLFDLFQARQRLLVLGIVRRGELRREYLVGR